MIIDNNKYFNLEDYSVKTLKKSDIYDIQNLCEKCSDYFILEQGSEPDNNTGRETLEMLPSKKGYDDKFALGVYDTQNQLIGLIDIIKDYPIENEWMLGLLLINPENRNKGLGKLLHNGLVDWVGSQKGEKIIIGVLDNNQKAFKFWSNIGYKLIKKTKLQREGKADTKISVMNYYL